MGSTPIMSTWILTPSQHRTDGPLDAKIGDFALLLTKGDVYMQTSSSASDVAMRRAAAIFLDVENILAGNWFLSQENKKILRRAVQWVKNRLQHQFRVLPHPQYCVAVAYESPLRRATTAMRRELRECGYQFYPTLKQKPNAADDQIIGIARGMLIPRKPAMPITHVAIVSADKDFLPFLEELGTHGYTTILVSPKRKDQPPNARLVSKNP